MYSLRKGTLAPRARAEAADERRLRAQAAEVAHGLARSLSYEHGKRFTVLYTGDLVALPNGHRRLSTTARIINQLAVSLGSVGIEVRDADGNVIDSPALQRGRADQAMRSVSHCKQRARLEMRTCATCSTTGRATRPTSMEAATRSTMCCRSQNVG